MNSLNIKFEENLLTQIKHKAKELRPFAADDEAMQLFIQDLFIRVFMDLQPHDLIYESIKEGENSELTPYALEINPEKSQSFLLELQQQNLSGYENMLIEVRKKLFRSFSAIDPLVSAEAPITFGLL